MRIDTLITALAAFAGGYAAGTLLAPSRGEETRKAIGEKVRAQTRWMEDRIHQLEAQVEAMKASLDQKLEALAAEETTDADQPADESWDVDPSSVERDLARMPRK
ncbi:MAG: YtxH domain-containing protein [Bacteroidota bacterium]